LHCTQKTARPLPSFWNSDERVERDDGNDTNFP
jgi:hypothetical protein